MNLPYLLSSSLVLSRTLVERPLAHEPAADKCLPVTYGTNHTTMGT